MRLVRSFKATLVATVFAVGAAIGAPAWADRGYGHRGYDYRGHDRGHDRGHGHYGRGGAPWALGFGLLAGTAIALAVTEPRPVYSRPAVVYAPPVYAPPPRVIAPSFRVVVVPPPPPAYVEQADWYYCAAPAGYYPYVEACPTGWMRVAPTPPG